MNVIRFIFSLHFILPQFYVSLLYMRSLVILEPIIALLLITEAEIKVTLYK